MVPSTVKLPPIVASSTIVTVPSRVGSTLRTVDPDPVLVVTPVPPSSTASVPVTFAAFSMDKPYALAVIWSAVSVFAASVVTYAVCAVSWPATCAVLPLKSLATKVVTLAYVDSIALALIVPSNDGDSLYTRFPAVPVVIVTPVPPCSTDKIPVMLPAVIFDNSDPSPEYPSVSRVATLRTLAYTLRHRLVALPSENWLSNCGMKSLTSTIKFADTLPLSQLASKFPVTMSELTTLLRTLP